MRSLLAFILAVGCVGAEPPPQPRCPASAPCPSCPLPKPPGEVSVAADAAKPEDLAKAKELAAHPSIPTETSPRFSPDGKRIAFVMSRSLYVADVGSKDPPKKIAELTRKFRRPMFSNDGAWIYFTSDEKGGNDALLDAFRGDWRSQRRARCELASLRRERGSVHEVEHAALRCSRSPRGQVCLLGLDTAGRGPDHVLNRGVKHLAIANSQYAHRHAAPLPCV